MLGSNFKVAPFINGAAPTFIWKMECPFINGAAPTLSMQLQIGIVWFQQQTMKMKIKNDLFHKKIYK